MFKIKNNLFFYSLALLISMGNALSLHAAASSSAASSSSSEQSTALVVAATVALDLNRTIAELQKKLEEQKAGQFQDIMSNAQSFLDTLRREPNKIFNAEEDLAKQVKKKLLEWHPDKKEKIISDAKVDPTKEERSALEAIFNTIAKVLNTIKAKGLESEKVASGRSAGKVPGFYDAFYKVIQDNPIDDFIVTGFKYYPTQHAANGALVQWLKKSARIKFRDENLEALAKQPSSVVQDAAMNEFRKSYVFFADKEGKRHLLEVLKKYKDILARSSELGYRKDLIPKGGLYTLLRIVEVREKNRAGNDTQKQAAQGLYRNENPDEKTLPLSKLRELFLSMDQGTSYYTKYSHGRPSHTYLRGTVDGTFSKKPKAGEKPKQEWQKYPEIYGNIVRSLLLKSSNLWIDEIIWTFYLLDAGIEALQIKSEDDPRFEKLLQFLYFIFRRDPASDRDSSGLIISKKVEELVEGLNLASESNQAALENFYGKLLDFKSYKYVPPYTFTAPKITESVEKAFLENLEKAEEYARYEEGGLLQDWAVRDFFGDYTETMTKSISESLVPSWDDQQRFDDAITKAFGKIGIGRLKDSPFLDESNIDESSDKEEAGCIIC